MTNNKMTIEDLAKTIKDLDRKMDAGFKKSDTRFDSIMKEMDKRFDDWGKKIDTRFNEQEKSTSARFIAIEDQIERLAITTMRGFEQVDKRFAQVDKRLDGIDVRLDGIDKQLNFMASEIATIKGELYRMGQKIDDLEKQVKAINKCTKEDVDMALKDIMGMKKRLDILEIEYRSRKVAH